MVSDSQRRANERYRKKSVKQLIIRFYPGDTDESMYQWLKSQPNTTGYIKKLIADDMKRRS